MDIILIVISCFLGFLGILIQPIKKGKGSVYKRINFGGYAILSLLLLTAILSIIKQLSDNKTAVENEKENEYLMLRKVQIGPGFLLCITFTDSIFMNSNNIQREIEFSKFSKSDRDLEIMYFNLYIDSVSKSSFFKLAPKVERGKTFFKMDLSIGSLFGGFYIIENGLMQCHYTIFKSNPYDEDINSKEDGIHTRYFKNKLLFLGNFDTTFNAGSLYQRIRNDFRNKKVVESKLSFCLPSKIEAKDIEEMKNTVKRIKNIDFIIDADLDASRFFVIRLKPLYDYTTRQFGNNITYTFSIRLESLPKEEYYHVEYY